jgi:predicted proteasome-type protease
MAVDSKAAGNLSCAFGLKLPVIFKTAFQVTVSRAVTQPTEYNRDITSTKAP